MSSGWPRVAGALTLLCLAAARADAQQATELGIQAIATAAEPELAVAGPMVAIRPSRRARVALLTGLGGSGGELAWRGELLGQFLLDPVKRDGWGMYAGGGVAAVAGRVDRGYLVLVIGVETAPGARRGWSAEVGVGGGVRIAVGYRWRRFFGRPAAGG